MDAPDLDGDSHGKLQRRSLGNVRSLYEKLDGRDKRDQRTERRFMIGAGVTALVAVAALAISSMTRAPDSGALERTRCVQEARVAAVWELKKELTRSSPEMPPDVMDKLLARRFDDAKPAATAECERAHPKAP